MTDQPDDTLPPVSEETLPLYLPLWKDGALLPDDAARVEELMRGNAEAEAILTLLDRSDQRLQSAFSSVLEAPVPIKLARAASAAGAELPSGAGEQRQTRHGRRNVVSIAAAACVALIVGVPGGYFLGEDQGRQKALSDAAEETKARFGWIAQIAGYHRLYSAEERHLVEVAASEADHIRQWIGARTGRNFVIPDLTAAGLEFRGARLLAVDGKPTAQLMYVPAGGGAPVGLCFLKTDAPDAEFAQQERDGFNMVTWRSGGYSFIAIGEETPARMIRVAQAAAVSL